MLVLSVRQPWAYAICAGIQDVLNLSTRPPFEVSSPTTLLICATGHPVPDHFDKLPDDRNITIKNEKLMGNIPPYEELQHNAIIGYVECTGIVHDADSFWAEQTEYKWADPVYNLTFTNPFMFDVPIPISHRVYGLFFRVAVSKKELLNSHKVNLMRPNLEGTCLKMPAADSILQSIDDGIEIVSYDLCETNVDYFIDSVTGQSFPIDSIDFIGKQRTIHKEVVSVEIGHYENEDNEPIHFRGYDPEEGKIWEVLSFHIK